MMSGGNQGLQWHIRKARPHVAQRRAVKLGKRPYHTYTSSQRGFWGRPKGAAVDGRHLQVRGNQARAFGEAAVRAVAVARLAVAAHLAPHQHRHRQPANAQPA